MKKMCSVLVASRGTHTRETELFKDGSCMHFQTCRGLRALSCLVYLLSAASALFYDCWKSSGFWSNIRKELK